MVWLISSMSLRWGDILATMSFENLSSWAESSLSSARVPGYFWGMMKVERNMRVKEPMRTRSRMKAMILEVLLARTAMGLFSLSSCTVSARSFILVNLLVVGFEGILHEHSNGHGADAAGDGGDFGGYFGNVLEIDVAD